MVNESGILYTIEGIAAGILMITTAYLIISTTTIYTPGDTHISDMQMEQLGNDVLAVMDTPINMRFENRSPLEIYIETDNKTGFRDEFLKLTKKNSQNWPENIKFNAVVHYRRPDDTVDYYPFSDYGNLTGSEHLVMVTRRVLIANATTINSLGLVPDSRPRSVLLEVLIWRD